jgi:hypothetical protein
MNRTEMWVVMLFIIGMTCIWIVALLEITERQQVCPSGEGLGYTNDSIVRGLSYDDYFCVYSKDLPITDVLQICTHEYSHTNLKLNDPDTKYTATGTHCTCK